MRQDLGQFKDGRFVEGLPRVQLKLSNLGQLKITIKNQLQAAIAAAKDSNTYATRTLKQAIAHESAQQPKTSKVSVSRLHSTPIAPRKERKSISNPPSGSKVDPKRAKSAISLSWLSRCLSAYSFAWHIFDFVLLSLGIVVIRYLLNLFHPLLNLENLLLSFRFDLATTQIWKSIMIPLSNVIRLPLLLRYRHHQLLLHLLLLLPQLLVKLLHPAFHQHLDYHHLILLPQF